MKKLILSLFILSLVVFQSCKDEEVISESPLLSNLTASKAAYQSAADGDWIAITEAEYDALAANLSDLTVSGLSEDKFVVGTNPWNSSANLTVLVGNNVATLPANSLVFAFKYSRYQGNTSTNARVKISETNARSGFSNVGNTLPEASGTASSFHYYVLKGNNSPTTANSAYLGFYSGGQALGCVIQQYSNINTNWGNLETEANNTSRSEVVYQSLSTTTKQW